MKVLYSPVKAFREILGNPRYIGPILIIIISLFLTLGTHYISASKHYVEAIIPSNRIAWTDMSDPSSMWTSNAPPGNVTALEAAYEILVGNYTVRALLYNSSEIWLRTTDIGTINCSEFKTFYYKLRYLHITLLLNASIAKLRLFSLRNESNYFEFDLLPLSRGYLNTSQAWIDANISLGEGASGWVQGSQQANWENITGIEFRLTFSERGRLSFQLNDLYFGGAYEPLFDAMGFADWLFLTLITSFFDIFLKWVILAGILWLTIKTFHSEGSPFRTLLIIVGYMFVIMFVYVPIDMLSVSQLSPLYFPYRAVFPGSAREIAVSSTITGNIYAANWTLAAPYSVFVVVWYVSHVWTIGLCTIALKLLQPFSWKKAAAISLVAYVMALVLRAMIPL